MDEILKYFPSLTDTQRRQFTALRELYGTWNEKINVISRRDIDNLYVNHVLHSLSIARFVDTIRGFGLRRGIPRNSSGHPLARMLISPHRPYRQESAGSIRNSCSNRIGQLYFPAR